MFRHKKSDSFFCRSSSICDSADLTSTEHCDSVTQFKNHIQILDYTDYCNTFFFLFI